jgi:hypothetical protein
MHDGDVIYGLATGTADAGSNATTTVDAERTEVANDYWNGCLIKFLTGTNAGLEREITDFVTGTITHVAFPAVVDAGDTYTLGYWSRVAGGADLDGAAMSITYNDYLKLECVDAEDGDSCYWSYLPEASAVAASNLNLSVGPAGTNKILLIRYKTSQSSAGLGLAVQLVYTGGAVEWALGTDTVPVYSGYLATSTYTIVNAGAAALDHIRLWAVSEKNACTEYILVDFVLVCIGTFTFPFVSKGVHFSGQNRNVKLEPPGRLGDITQYLGSKSSPITVTGSIDSGTGWHDGWGEDLGILLKICHESNTNVFQWFTCDVPKVKFKVTVDDWDIGSDGGDAAILSYVLNLSEYRRGDASGEAYWERWGTYP